MDMDLYQHEASKTVKSNIENNLAYFTLGLVGEAGEVAEKLKKKYRDLELNTEELAKELGDVLWYLSQVSKCINYSLSEIANMNLDKLQDRQRRNKISGSGDNR